MIQPGSKVYVMDWGWGNDEEHPAVVVSVNRKLVANVVVEHWNTSPFTFQN